MIYGLIGEQLGHSYSVDVHKRLYGYDYRLKEIRPDELESFLAERDFLGVNVTIPYKETALAAWLHQNAAVKSEEYREDGVYITATVRRSALKRFLPFIWSEE